MHVSVQEQEEAKSVLMRFETCLSVRALCTLVLNWVLSHLFLFPCLNCDLYLFVQMQDDAKENSVRSSLRANRKRLTSIQFSFSSPWV